MDCTSCIYRVSLEQLKLHSNFSVSSTACKRQATFKKLPFEIIEVKDIHLYYVNTIELMVFIAEKTYVRLM